MPASQIEQQASIRVYNRLDAKQKGNPADVRTIFAGRIADKWQAKLGMVETVNLVISDMRTWYSISPGTTRMICQRQIARLLAAGDVAGRAHFITCLA